MIIATIQYLVTPGSREIVLEMTKKCREKARKFDGNIECCSMPSIYDRDEVIAIEKWASIEALKAYMASEECKIFQMNRKPYLVDASRDTQIYEGERIRI